LNTESAAAFQEAVVSVDTQTALLLLSDAVVSGPRLLKKHNLPCAIGIPLILA